MKSLNLSIIAAFAALFTAGFAMGAAPSGGQYLPIVFYNKLTTPSGGKPMIDVAITGNGFGEYKTLDQTEGKGLIPTRFLIPRHLENVTVSVSPYKRDAVTFDLSKETIKKLDRISFEGKTVRTVGGGVDIPTLIAKKTYRRVGGRPAEVVTETLISKVVDVAPVEPKPVPRTIVGPTHAVKVFSWTKGIRNFTLKITDDTTGYSQTEPISQTAAIFNIPESAQSVSVTPFVEYTGFRSFELTKAEIANLARISFHADVETRRESVGPSAMRDIKTISNLKAKLTDKDGVVKEIEIPAAR